MFDRLRFSDKQFNRLALLGIAFGFALLLTAFAATIATMISAQRATGWVRHSYQVQNEIDRLLLAVERTETATRGYLLAPDDRRVLTRRQNVALIEPTLAELRRMTSDNHVQQQLVAQLKSKIEDQLKTSNDMMARALGGNLEPARAEFANRVKVRQIDQIRALGQAMSREETRLLLERQNTEAGRRSLLQVILAVTGALLVLLSLAAFFLVRRYTTDLTGIRDRLNRLNSDLEGAVAERTADLRRANEEIQRFAYIVSHDLRSPLVNILGFTAELEQTNKSLGALIDRAEKEAPQIITEDSRAAREDLPEAIGFIRTSTQKMDRLINAILRLSREGRRTLTPEPLDMGKVLADVAASFEQKLLEAGASLTIEEPIPEITSDRVAIEQIFSNLIENAVKYGQPGRSVEVRIRGVRRGDRLIYEVADNGRGIDARDHDRVFDLFRRSGTQDQPGEGIGLAHVRALAYRLGGFIDLQSEIGQGATFQVNLPATYVDSGARN